MTQLLLTACLVSCLGQTVDVTTVDITVTIWMVQESQEQRTDSLTTEFVLAASAVGPSESEQFDFVMTATARKSEDPMLSAWRPLLCFCTSDVEAPVDVSVPIDGMLSTTNAPVWAMTGDLFLLTDHTGSTIGVSIMREPVSSNARGVYAGYAGPG